MIGSGTMSSVFHPSIPVTGIADVCRRYRIAEMGLFGSVARGDAAKASDADIFVEFEAGCHPGLGWFDLEDELEGLFGRHVYLSQKSLLRPQVREQALREAVVLYSA